MCPCSPWGIYKDGEALHDPRQACSVQEVKDLDFAAEPGTGRLVEAFKGPDDVAEEQLQKRASPEVAY